MKPRKTTDDGSALRLGHARARDAILRLTREPQTLTHADAARVVDAITDHVIAVLAHNTSAAPRTDPDPWPAPAALQQQPEPDDYVEGRDLPGNDPEALPPCAEAMRCLCAGHASGDAVTDPCDTNEASAALRARLRTSVPYDDRDQT